MNHVCGVVPLLLLPTSVFARDGGVKCEAESYSEKDESLVVVCPPPFAFSPIRVKMVIGPIDHFGWQGVDLKKPTPVQVMSANTPGGRDVFVRLPIQKGSHRWLAWRKFRSITRLALYEEQSVGAYQRKGN